MSYKRRTLTPPFTVPDVRLRNFKRKRGRPALRAGIIGTAKGAWSLHIAIRLREYRDAGCLTRALCGHPHEVQLWKIWRVFRTCPLIYGKLNPAGNLAAWLEEAGLPPPEKIRRRIRF
jgi:hypothetical protein